MQDKELIERLRFGAPERKPLPGEVFGEWDKEALERTAMEAADRLEALVAELERERMRLVACGVVAMCNTPETASKSREMHPDYWSASCADVASAVDREMALRSSLARAQEEIEGLRAELASALDDWNALVKASGSPTNGAAIGHVEGLRNFARGVLEGFPDSFPDGFDLQDLAIKRGLLVGETVTKPCRDEGCRCAEYHGEKEMSEGVTCYRRAPIITGAQS